MDFSYYYLIQDILGVIIAAVGLRLIRVYFAIMRNDGFELDCFLCLIGNLFLVFSGINLILLHWGLRTWIISGVLFIIGRLFGTIVYWTIMKKDIE